MEAHRRILAGAPDRLRSGGRVYLEIQFDQGPAVANLMQAAGLKEPAILKDYAGHERVVTAQKGE
jgi:release factor glutamine methyltransferase